MKKFSIFGCIAATLLCLTGCEPEGNNGYEGTNYTYDEATGVFATTPASITVPAATYTSDPTTGVVTTTPGVAVLTVTGTV